MILVDLNQVMIANLMMQVGGKKHAVVEEDLVRHMVLNSLRSYRKKYGEKYGELVICCDDSHYWRKDKFPYYKAHRKKAREKSHLDWKVIFTLLNAVREEIKENFPYKVIQSESAEADDVIGALCHKYGQLGIRSSDAELILILSSDKDFVQLQKYANVEQFSPAQKKFITTDNPARFMHEHILRGDTGDGVPNFLSADDVFVVDGKKQTPLASKKVNAWNGLDPKDYCDDKMLRNYHRNQELVDLDFIPKSIQEDVIRQFEEQESGDRSKLFNYFVKKKMKHLMECINDF